MSESKPRIRVSAGSKAFTTDNFQNFAASLGYGTSNLSSGSTYGFNPITRNHTLLEWAYRGSWLVKVIIDAVADDMIREGISIESDMRPDKMDQLTAYMRNMLVYDRLNEALKWSRLYGGCIAAIMIDGQEPHTPLRIDSIGKGQFKGLLVLDRWMVWPHLDDPVKEYGRDYGMPRSYEVVSDARVIPHLKLHYSRCIRFDGIELPYWQKMAENYWGLSVIEPLYDRLIAFDSTSQGAAQLVYRAHLRTLSIEKLRELIAFGGEAYSAVLEQIRMIRLYQANEGITVLDATDKFETYAYSFGGLSDVMIQFAQQLSGAAQIPLVRLFGQSPAGLNATGDADIRNYYDYINSMQEARLREPIQLLLDLCHRSKFGEPLPEGFNFSFSPLWQLADTEKAGIASQITQAIVGAQGAGIVSNAAALKELRQSSKITGVWSNVTDEEIADADQQPPPMEMPLQPGQEQPGQASAAPQPGEGQEAGKPVGPGEKPAEDEAVLASRAAVLNLLPEHAKRGHPSGIDEPQHVGERFGHLHPIHEIANLGAKADQSAVKRFVTAHTGDQLPMIDVHGIPVVIETEKGQRRSGNSNWPLLPAHYGYFQATSSAEGNDQMDCFIGDDPESEAVWIIEQLDPRTGAFDEHKCLVSFPDRDTAVAAFKAAYGDGADERMGTVRRMSITGLKQFLSEWPAGQSPNGACTGIKLWDAIMPKLHFRPLSVGGSPAYSLMSGEAIADMVEFAYNAPKGGCFVEFGVYQGGSAWHLLQVAKEQGRELHLFDTFNGIPEATERDAPVVVGAFGNVDLEQVKEHLAGAVFHIGMFPYTMPDDMPPIAFAHIDCDQYVSCGFAIELFTPLMLPGAVMLFDDYVSTTGVTDMVHETYQGRHRMTRCNKAYVVNE